MSRYADQVTRLRAALQQDPYSGNETRTWDTSEQLALAATVQPASTTELTDRRQVTITRWTVHCPPADVAATDRIRWGGHDHEVDGEVGLHKRRGVPHHLEFTIRRVASA